LLVLTSGSAALKHDFWDRLFNLRRVRPLYAALAVAIPFAVICLSILLSIWLDQPADQFRLSGGAGLIPLVMLALVLAPICEEVGWHGYGADSLREEFGMLPATFLFAALWSAWHAPLVLVPGTYQHELAVMDSEIFVANFFVSIIPAGIIANWFYYKNDRSIAAAILLHAMLNSCGADCCRAGRQDHRHPALCGDRGGSHHRRSPSLHRRSAQFPQGAIALLPRDRSSDASSRSGISALF
jgi:hypothetical protein